MNNTLLAPPPEPVIQNEPSGEVEQEPSVQADVRRWLKRIENAENKWCETFKEMRENMEFACGYQWENQKTLRDPRYKTNMTNRMVNQKVATLYAKNPTIEVLPQKRLNYRLWDGKIETLTQAVEMAQQYQMQMLPVPMEIMALLSDVMQGQQYEETIKRVCDTLTIAAQRQLEIQKPDFKEQMKQLVRRVVICKVGYVRTIFCDDTSAAYKSVSSVEPQNLTSDRTARANRILDRIEKGDIDASDAEVQTLQSLALSLGATQQGDDEQDKLPQRVEYDFLPATSVIPDERCRNLKEFVGANWIAIKFPLPRSEINELFGVEVKSGTNDGDDEAQRKPNNVIEGETNQDDDKDPIVDLFEVFDRKAKVRFFICKGYKGYVLPPEPLYPAVAGFWPIDALTFNDVESDSCSEKANLYPPSDVDLVRDAQMEWNRTRDALRDQRNANAPSYVTRKNALSDGDKQAIKNRVPNALLELESIPPEQEPGKFISILQVAAIDPAVYDTEPLAADMMLSSGMQEANMGAAQPNVTATVGTIAEQSRMTVAASNVDDLDDFLTRIAQKTVEMMLRAMSAETIEMLVGLGASWPEQDASTFLNEIAAKVKAASSGRPNKALQIANMQQLAPFLLTAGANPKAVIRKVVETLDEDLDYTEFYPLPVPSAPAGETGSQSEAAGSNIGSGQPAPREPLGSGSPVLASK